MADRRTFLATLSALSAGCVTTGGDSEESKPSSEPTENRTAKSTQSQEFDQSFLSEEDLVEISVLWFDTIESIRYLDDEETLKELEPERDIWISVAFGVEYLGEDLDDAPAAPVEAEPQLVDIAEGTRYDPSTWPIRGVDQEQLRDDDITLMGMSGWGYSKSMTGSPLFDVEHGEQFALDVGPLLNRPGEILLRPS